MHKLSMEELNRLTKEQYEDVDFKQYEKVCRNILKLAHLKPKKMGIKYYLKSATDLQE